jgi:tetratricopeptide (TPR) repeat protein
MIDRAKITEAAERFVRAGKFEAAIAEYGKLLGEGDQDVSIGTIIGDLYLRLHMPERAVRFFEANAVTLEKKGSYAQALAILKKIGKLGFAGANIFIQMGDLYARLGFAPEAQAEYLKAAAELETKDDAAGLLPLYQKLMRLDRDDISVRLKLARLFIKKGLIDRALDELNDIAEILIARNDLESAEKILLEARPLSSDDTRTISNLILLKKKAGRMDEAFTLAEQGVRKHGGRPQFLQLLADLYLDAGREKEGQEILQNILAGDPENVEARARLGMIEIRNGRLDRAYELFEPLVALSLNKNKEDKAVGLLGLILMSGTMHVPSLEKLAAIYRQKNRPAQLETVYRVLLNEYGAKKMEAKRLAVLKELEVLRDAALQSQGEPDEKPGKAPTRDSFEEPRRESGKKPEPTSGERVAGEVPFLTEEDRNVIRMNIAKADLYFQESLVRNARRILKNLLMLYPDLPEIQQRLDRFGQTSDGISGEDIAKRIGRISQREAVMENGLGSPSSERPLSGEDTAANSVSPSEIFGAAGLDSPAGRENIGAEASAGPEPLATSPSTERDFSEIVSDFRRQVEAEVGEGHAEVRYNLGLVFMEQDLIDEAIEEFKRAAREPSLAADCFSLISHCCRIKEDLKEAMTWLESALPLAQPGSHQRWALAYDLALLYEDTGDKVRALEIFREIRKWNATFRDTAKKIEALEKSLR